MRDKRKHRPLDIVRSVINTFMLMFLVSFITSQVLIVPEKQFFGNTFYGKNSNFINKLCFKIIINEKVFSDREKNKDVT